jgi:hypothetical protein
MSNAAPATPGHPTAGELTPSDCRVEPRWQPLCSKLQLTSAAAWLSPQLAGESIREVKSRSTQRIVLRTATETCTIYLKRHGSPSLWERVKPRLHGQSAVFGAEPEVAALRGFAAAGIPAPRLVAHGGLGGRSFLATEEIADGVDLKSLSLDPATSFDANAATAIWWRRAAHLLADITRRMHAAGWQHQDFYLNHILWERSAGGLSLKVIDLGRAIRYEVLPPRWKTKDLAQLNYSAAALPCSLRLRFLRLYLGRPFTRADRGWIRRLALKSAWIARHSKRHGL